MGHYMKLYLCIICDNAFNVYPSKELTAKFCSRKCRTTWQKGKPAWNKGKAFSDETKRRMGEAQRNSIVCQQQVREMINANKGKRYSRETEFKKGGRVSPATEFKKGIVPWNTGLKLPQFSGEKAFAWKGGINPLSRRIRGLTQNNEWREQVFERDNYICQDCGAKNGDGKTMYLNAHHKESFTNIVEGFLKEYDQFSLIEDKETLVRLAMKYKPFWDIDNGITLCEDCHNLTKQGRKKCVGAGFKQSVA